LVTARAATSPTFSTTVAQFSGSFVRAANASSSSTSNEAAGLSGLRQAIAATARHPVKKFARKAFFSSSASYNTESASKTTGIASTRSYRKIRCNQESTVSSMASPLCPLPAFAAQATDLETISANHAKSLRRSAKRPAQPANFAPAGNSSPLAGQLGALINSSTISVVFWAGSIIFSRVQAANTAVISPRRPRKSSGPDTAKKRRVPSSNDKVSSVCRA